MLNDGIYRIEDVGDGFIDVALRSEDFPAWIQPTGAVDAYQKGARVTHNGVRYISLIDANIVVPGTDARYWEAVGEEEHSTVDETFDGIIAPLVIPRDFLDLVREVEVFQAKASETPNTGVVSESFQNYSYSMATTSSGMPATWKESFATRLNSYRRMFEERIL